MERYICVHGHFYQPPRENPWLETIELQDSAYPYHDWNERIAAECYATNATSRILGEEGRIVRMVNNYARISFNFGPTLLAWMEDKAPDVYAAILEADQESQRTFSGHGSALAQAYNHMILPLANRRDKDTQVHWGIRDFEHRFGRAPEGMWLPETAVDLETLEVLVEKGIRFTILAPHQAHRVRQIGADGWQDVSGGTIDPTMAYRLNLPSGGHLVAFFYDGPVSRAVAFEKLLRNGEAFAQRLLSRFSEARSWPQLVHIATDGETYGHHHRFGDMALAYALDYVESRSLVRLTNYGEYMEKHPPTHEVEIYENTSWSCSHGIERWRGDCGCSTGGHPEWHQAWRGPLREALDWLRDSLAPVYEREAAALLRDPWKARDDYIEIVLNRSRGQVDAFLRQHAVRELNEPEKTQVLKLLELQRHAMFMYTSCGWFFDDLSGIETVQVIQYAGRALQLAEEISGEALESRFLELLEQARSNIPEHADGRCMFEKFVRPAILDLERVAAHYALSSLFEEYEGRTSIYCYTIDQEDYQCTDAGKAKLAVGRARVTWEVTGESKTLNFCVLHWGDHNLNGGVRDSEREADYEALVQECTEAFTRGDLVETVRAMDKHFGSSTYSLRSLFRDEQRKVLDLILESTLSDAEAIYRQVYENHAPMMRFLKDLGTPSPRAFSMAAEMVLNASLRRAFEEEELHAELVEPILEEARLQGVSLDADTLEYAMRQSIERRAERLMDSPLDLGRLEKLDEAISLTRSMPFQTNLWKVQNIFYEIMQSVMPEQRKRAEQEDRDARQWVERFRVLGEKLSIMVG